MMDPSQIQDFLDYDPATGFFIWKERARSHFTRTRQWKNWNARYPGTVAGHVGKKGYRSIAIFDKLYKAHRLAWAYVNGEWPEDQVDHVNGDRDDNRIANLRAVTNAVNGRNLSLQVRNKSGRIGVTRYNYQSRDCWVARIRIEGELIHLGYFATVDEASEARQRAEIAFCFHPNHGKSKSPLKSRGFPKRGDA